MLTLTLSVNQQCARSAARGNKGGKGSGQSSSESRDCCRATGPFLGGRGVMGEDGAFAGFCVNGHGMPEVGQHGNNSDNSQQSGYLKY